MGSEMIDKWVISVETVQSEQFSAAGKAHASFDALLVRSSP